MYKRQLPTSYSSADLPSTFSSFFSTGIQNIRDKFDQTPLQPCPLNPPSTGTPFSCFHDISETEASNTLKSMSLKSCELDPISASLFSDCLPCLLPAITDIVKVSLQTNSLPSEFKTAIVRPLLKNNLDSNDLKKLSRCPGLFGEIMACVCV